MKNKTSGVCAGMLALGLVGLGAPASYAKGHLAVKEAVSGSDTATSAGTSSTSAASESSPADLRQRIDALKAELAELNTQLAAEKDERSAAPAAEVPPLFLTHCLLFPPPELLLLRKRNRVRCPWL